MLDECYYLEIYEPGERIPAGDSNGYDTVEEARKAALRLVDDASPQNVVRIFKRVAVAYLGGDGGPSLKE